MTNGNDEYLKKIFYEEEDDKQPRRSNDVRSRKVPLFPSAKTQLQNLGERLRAARVRRGMTMEEIAERASISRPTLAAVEKGNPTVAIGAYVSVMNMLGMHQDLALICVNDELGKAIELTNIRKIKRVRRKRSE